jgi:hypothetical protein
MTERKPQNDNALIDSAEDPPVPSHQGSSGGGMAREVGVRDEEKTATGADPELTKVRGGDQPEGGDRPTPPQHHQ